MTKSLDRDLSAVPPLRSMDETTRFVFTPEATTEKKVLVIDDEEGMRKLLATFLQGSGYLCRTARDSEEALGILQGEEFAAILCDIVMPGKDGIEFLPTIKQLWPDTEVIMVTAYKALTTAIDAMRRGAFDYLVKPLNLEEVAFSLERALAHRALVLENREYRLYLEKKVERRTRDLEKITLGLVIALEKANKFNDSDTGNHIRRVCGYSEILSMGAGCAPALVIKIKNYASLHDVGKVGIPDRILKKPGKLTEEEFEEMKKHTLIGHEILSSAGADVVAQNIALYHHERYGGGGYPYGIKGEEIPVEARIVTLADAFDALTTKRCYKRAFSVEEACQNIGDLSGRQFDPKLVKLFFDLMPQILAVKKQYVDDEE